MPLEFLLFFVISLLTPETEELICTNMVVLVMVLVVGWAASPLPFGTPILTPAFTPASRSSSSFLPLSPQTETETSDVLDWVSSHLPLAQKP